MIEMRLPGIRLTQEECALLMYGLSTPAEMVDALWPHLRPDEEWTPEMLATAREWEALRERITACGAGLPILTRAQAMRRAERTIRSREEATPPHAAVTLRSRGGMAPMSGHGNPRILAIDAGFTAMGIVVAEGDRIVLWDVCRTQRTAAKRGIRVADDDAERAQQLAVRLHNLIVTWNPAGVVVELPHGGAQGARANRAMGIATGVVAAVLAVANMPSEWVTPGDVKKAATGRRDASKHAVQEAVRRRFHWTSWPEMKQDVEHVADAAAAILAAEGGTLIRTVERMREVAG